MDRGGVKNPTKHKTQANNRDWRKNLRSKFRSVPQFFAGDVQEGYFFNTFTDIDYNYHHDHEHDPRRRIPGALGCGQPRYSSVGGMRSCFILLRNCLLRKRLAFAERLGRVGTRGSGTCRKASSRRNSSS